MSFNTFFHAADPDAVGNHAEDQPPGIGLFDVSLAEARAFTSKAGKDTVVLKWELNTDGHTWPQLLGFASQAAANFTANQIRELGADPSSCTTLEQLNDELQRFVGLYYTVEVVQNGEYLNTYVRERAGQATATDVPAMAPVAAAGGVVADDDIPF
jgi:hypothetical protein